MVNGIRRKAKTKRAVNRLEPVMLKKLKPGSYCDGNGLYLVVQPSGSRSWILRIAVRGRMRDIGLGGLAWRSLAEARTEAAQLRARARRGEDIMAARRRERQKATSALTFEEAAIQVHEEVAPTLKNEHNRKFWLRSLDIHVFPHFGSKPVDTIDSSDVLRAIGPVWTKKPDVARKLLTRISRVMDWSTIKGLRNVQAGDMTFARPNPCLGVRAALPKQPKEGQHSALAYPRVPEFLIMLRASDRCGLTVKLALEFTILTATRTSETLEAEWKEFDIDGRMWSIPAGRMKMDEPHTIPLSDRCIEILQGAKRLAGDSRFVFPSLDAKRLAEGDKMKMVPPLSNVAMLRALQRMEGCEELTVHGFRSAFKTWAEETTGFNAKVMEASLAHKVTGVEGRYLRTTFVEQRRQLMDAWARFCTTEPRANVVRIRS